MSILNPSTEAQLKEDKENGHARPTFAHDRKADDQSLSSVPKHKRSHQDVVAGLHRGPSTIQPYGGQDCRTNGETPGDKTGEGLEQSDTLSFIRHAVSHTGNALEQHHAVLEKQIFREEQWLIFSTARPLSAVYKLQWFRAVILALGMYELLRPEGLFNLAWVTEIPEATLKKAHMLRFHALTLRNGDTVWTAPMDMEFGLLQAGCKVPMPHTVSALYDTITLRYASEASFDGWYLATGKGDPKYDPKRYRLDTSLDGVTWDLLANSHAQNEPSGTEGYKQNNQNSLPEERNTEILFSFCTWSHLWQYYLVILAHGISALSLVSSAFVAIWAPVNGKAPVLCLAWGILIGALLKGVAWISLVTNGLALPFGPLKSWTTTTGLALDAVWHAFVFPGPLVFGRQQYVAEQALVWGLLHSISRFVSGSSSIAGPVVGLLAGVLLMRREHRRRKAVGDVKGDMKLFDAVWERILKADEAKQWIVWLTNFELDNQPKSPIGVGGADTLSSQKGVSSEARMCHDGSAQDAEVPGCPSRMPIFSSAHSHSAAEAPEIDLESSTPPLGWAEGKARKKLLIELRSPMMQIVVGKAMGSEKNSTLDQLYAQAMLLDPIFRVRIQRLAGMSCGYFPVAATDTAGSIELRLWSELEKEQHAPARARLRWPEIKHVNVAIQKMAIHYHGSASLLVDIVRQRIVFDTLAELCKCVELIANDPDLEIMRFENRFDPRTDALKTAGYRDVVVVLRLVTPLTTFLGIAGHSCELQLAHRDMAKLISTAQQYRFRKFKQQEGYRYHAENAKDNSSTPYSELLYWRRLGLLASPCATRASRVRGHPVSCMSRTIHEEEAEEIELEELPPLIADQPDGVAELDSEAPELKKRVYEVLRMRVHVKGDFLHASLADVHHGVRNSNTPSVIFAHPLGSLSKLPIQVLLLVYGLYFGVSTIFEGLTPMSLNKIRHIRFSTLETRVPKSTLTNVGISRLSLLLSSRRNDPLRPGLVDSPFWPDSTCLVAHSEMLASEGVVTEILGASLVMTLSQSTKINGWSMTSSLAAGSEVSDPVRFVLSYAKIVDYSSYSLSDCLLGNEWRSAEQVLALSADDKRAAVIEELMKVPRSWCPDSSSRCEALSNNDLLRLCIPARSVREEDWLVVSASKCRPSVNDIVCIPRLGQNAKFEYYSLDRGSTHIFDLRPTWFTFVGVSAANLCISIFCIITAALAVLGKLNQAGVAFGLIQLVPGTLALVCAIAYTTSPRSFSCHTSPRESVIWWTISFSSILFGVVIIFKSAHVMRAVYIPFLLHIPLNVFQNLVILGDSPSEVDWLSVNSWGSTGLFLWWCTMTILRQIILRQSSLAISQDCDNYDAEWTRIKQDLESNTVIRDLDDMISAFDNVSRGVRPLQHMCDPLHHNPRLKDHDPIRPLSYMPRVMHQGRYAAPSAVVRMLDLCGLAKRIFSCASICSSLDTLYLQACTLEPIFNFKVQQLSKSARGEFLSRSTNNGSGGAAGNFLFVSAEHWNRAGGLKPVDRAIEKLTRVYRGDVSLLLDVVRQCIVFESMQDLLKAMRTIQDDGELEVVRIKNRMSDTYDARRSGGYRDCLVNVRIKTEMTKKLGLDNHVCEVQLILKQFMVHRTLDGHKRYVAFRNKRCE